MSRYRSHGFVRVLQSNTFKCWLSLCAVVFLCAESLSADGPATQKKTLLFVADENYAPVTYVENGQAKGLYVDIGRAIASKMNSPVEIELLNWAEAQKMVLDGRADAADGMAINAERLKLYDFSEPLVDLTYSFFQRQDAPVIENVDYAVGKRIGVTQGGYPSQFLKDRGSLQVVMVANYVDGFAKLRSGDIDALAADTWVAAYLIQQNNIANVRISGEPFAVRKSAIAVRKGNDQLLAEINQAILQIRDTELPQILNKSSPKQIIFLSQDTLWRIVLVGGFSVFALLVLILALWVRTLKKSQSERDQSMNDLAVSEDRFRALFENAPEAIVLFDLDADRFVDANPKALELFGMTLEEALNSGPSDTYEDEMSVQSVRCFLDEKSARALTGETVRFERRVRNKNGSLTECEVQLIAMPAKKRRLIRANYVDLTERKRSEENLRKLNQELDERVRERTLQLEDANRELRGSLELQRKFQSELIVREKVANILPMSTILAHKLNTPVGNIITAATAIQNKTQLVKEANGHLNRAVFQDFLEGVGEASELIAGSAGKAANIIKSYQNVIVDRSSAQRSVFNVYENVERLVTVLESVKRNPNVTIRTVVDPELFVDGYSGLLSKAIDELVQNALIHAFDENEPGEICIATRVDSDTLVLSIEDDGKGIPSESQARVFDPFYMADMSRGGSGLGLTTVYDIVTGTMRGSIRLENVIPHGSRFVVILPLKAPVT